MLKLIVEGPPSLLASCRAARRVQLVGDVLATQRRLMAASPLSAVEFTV
jgi:hypothetical protein